MNFWPESTYAGGDDHGVFGGGNLTHSSLPPRTNPSVTERTDSSVTERTDPPVTERTDPPVTERTEERTEASSTSLLVPPMDICSINLLSYNFIV